MVIDFLKLSDEDKAKLLTMLVISIEEEHRIHGGRVYGTYQLLSILDKFATQLGMCTCSKCGRSK